MSGVGAGPAAEAEAVRTGPGAIAAHAAVVAGLDRGGLKGGGPGGGGLDAARLDSARLEGRRRGGPEGAGQ